MAAPTPVGGEAPPVSRPSNDGATESRLLDNMVLFARLLRVGDTNPTPTQVADWVAALQHINIESKQQTKNAARATLVSNAAELEWFEAAFELFWQARDPAELEKLELGLMVTRSEQIRLTETAVDEPGEGESHLGMTWSEREQLARKPFADLDRDERRAVEQLIATIDWAPPPVRTRRRTRGRRGNVIDLRSALRRNLRNGGELIDLARLRARKTARPLVALCDVSGSMEPYSRLLLHFLYALNHRQRHRTKVESFAFGTRLTRLSRDLELRNIDSALAGAAHRINDWGSGTRTADALRAFHRDWAPRVLGRGAVVLIISDGWDRGDPEQLGREMARLSRTCGRVIWLNPLLGSPDYQPLTRGLIAALPHVDDFLPIHNLRSLEQLSSVLQRSAGKLSPERSTEHQRTRPES